VALIRCLAVLEALKVSNNDEQIGVDIVKRAVEEPLAPWPKTPGVEGSIVVQEIKKRKGNDGYNVRLGNTKTSSKPAWWTRKRSPAPRSKTQRRLPDCS